MRVYEYIDDPDGKKTYVVTDSIPGGTLHSILSSQDSGFEETLSLNYLRQLLSAIQYCHEEHPNVHLDIKLENMKFNGTTVVVCDFRMHDFIVSKEDADSIPILYMPPEMLDQGAPEA